MNKFWLIYKEYILISTFPIVIVGFVFLVINPMIKKIDENYNVVQEKKIDESEIAKKLESFSLIESQISTIKKNENVLSVGLTEDKLIDFVQEIEKVGEITRNKIRIQAEEAQVVRSKKEDKVDKIEDSLFDSKKIIFKIDLEGSFNNLVNFFHRIENLKYSADIVQFEIKKQKTETMSRDIFSQGNDGESDNEEDRENKVYSVLRVAVYIIE